MGNNDGAVEHPQHGWKETSKKAISVLHTWIFYSACFALLFSVFAIEFVHLGSWFTNSLLAAWILAFLTGGLSALWLHRRKKEESEGPSGWTITSRQKRILERCIIPVGLLVVITAIVVPFALVEIKEDSNAEKSELARQRFNVVSYLGKGPEFEIEAFDQTLAELEDSHQLLRDKWTSPRDAKRIHVWLYRDIREYHNVTGRERSTGSLWCSQEYGPVVAIPLEEAPSTSTDEAVSQTPMHEMVHALMCQSTGWEGFLSIPPWFHEGMAMRYQTAGFQRFWVRGISRVQTWWKRDKLLNRDEFCHEHPSGMDREQQSILYTSASEFIRFLESGYGIDTLNLIVDDVGTGAAFDESMERRLGGTCKVLYKNWTESF